MISEIFVFWSGEVLAFNEAGQHIPEHHGRGKAVLRKLAQAASDAVWFYVSPGGNFVRRTAAEFA